MRAVAILALLSVTTALRKRTEEDGKKVAPAVAGMHRRSVSQSTSQSALESTLKLKRKTTVLPLGDSITFGCGDGCEAGLGCSDECAQLRPTCTGGWRSWLWTMLSPGSNVSNTWDFVGTQQNGNGDTDLDHEGYPGFTIEQVDALKDGWVPLNPDVILLHLGTNNLGGYVADQTASEAVGHMKNLLTTIFTNLPRTKLLLSTLIGSSLQYGGSKHAEFNEGLKGLATEFAAQGFQIKIVDMAVEAGIGEYCDPTNCCPFLEGVHPTGDGYKLMAQVWYNHLKMHM